MSQAGTQALMATVTTTAYDPVSANDSASNSTLVSVVSSGGGGGGAFSPEWLLLALLARQSYRRSARLRVAGPYAGGACASSCRRYGSP